MFDALDAGLRMQRVFTPAAKAGILLDPPQALGGVPEGEREHRSGLDSFHSENLFARPIPRCSPMISDVS